jgi:hypothetical protein
MAVIRMFSIVDRETRDLYQHSKKKSTISLKPSLLRRVTGANYNRKERIPATGSICICDGLIASS